MNPIKDTNSGLIGPLIICKKVKTNGILFMHRKQRALDGHTLMGHAWMQVSNVTDFELSLFFSNCGRVIDLFFLLHLQGFELLFVLIFLGPSFFLLCLKIFVHDQCRS